MTATAPLPVAQDDLVVSDVGASRYPPLSLCLGFGVGTAGVSIVLNTIAVYFPTLMSTVLGMSPALAGTLVMVSKIYDAFADIGIGALSDRTETRWGRRRPYLLFGALVSFASLMMIFVVPVPTGTMGIVLYMGVALVIYSTVYSMFNVPYLAMPAEMTSGNAQRLRLISYRTACLGLGQLVALALSAWLIKIGGGGVGGYRLMGVAMATLALVTMLASFFGTARARFDTRRTDAPHRLTRADLASLAGNRPLMMLLGAKLAQYVSFGILQPANLLFLLNVLKVGYTGMIHLAVVQNLAVFVSMPAWSRIARRIGKRNAYLLAQAIMIPATLSWWWTDASITLPAIWWRAALFGFASGGALLMSTSMLPDTMEYDYLRTGKRREGVFASLYSVNEKLGFAIGAAVVGYGLALGGYVATTGGRIIQQAPDAIAALYLIKTALPALLLAGGAILVWLYRLDDDHLQALRAGKPRT